MTTSSERQGEAKPETPRERTKRRIAETLFERLDLNGDGVLDADELRAFGGEAAIDACDRNGDGVLGRDEFMELLARGPGAAGKNAAKEEDAMERKDDDERRAEARRRGDADNLADLDNQAAAEEELDSEDDLRGAGAAIGASVGLLAGMTIGGALRRRLGFARGEDDEPLER